MIFKVVDILSKNEISFIIVVRGPLELYVVICSDDVVSFLFIYNSQKGKAQEYNKLFQFLQITCWFRIVIIVVLEHKAKVFAKKEQIVVTP